MESTSLIRAKLELVSDKDICHISDIDGRKVSNNWKAYSKANSLGYYVLCNTWLMMLREYSTYGWVAILHYMYKNGLLETIKAASDTADEIVHEQEVTNPVFGSIVKDIQMPLAKGIYAPVNAEKNAGFDPMATALQILRYPKRFSPLKADKIREASISDFIATENRTKLLQRRGYSPYLISYVRSAMYDLLPWKKVTREVTKCLKNNHSLSFTTGVGLDSGSSLGSKLQAVSRSFPEYFREPFGIPYLGSYPQVETEYYGPGIGKFNSLIRDEHLWNGHVKACYPKRSVRVAAVPKSYKAARIIAVEETYRQSKARAVAEILEKYLPKNIPLTDQSQQQALAAIGSIQAANNDKSSFCTIDLSHASDCISKSLAMEIFPYDFYSQIQELLGTHTVIDGKERLMQQMSTAGNALTFILECLVFTSIAIAAIEIQCQHDEEISISLTGPKGKHSYKDVPSVYGDDIITYSWNYETLYDVLTSLGFIVNATKSFHSDSLYRESCGEEYYAGICMSSTYFPRFPLEGSIGKKVAVTNKYVVDRYKGTLVDTTSSLVSLQQRLSTTCYPAAQFIYYILKDAYPRMTTSPFGSANGDCWGYEDTWETRYAPAMETTTIPSNLVSRKSTTVFTRTINKEYERFGKFLPYVRYDLKKEPDSLSIRAYELFKYHNFLERGPRYDSELDRLLGVTSAPRTLNEVFGVPKVIWSIRDCVR